MQGLLGVFSMPFCTVLMFCIPCQDQCMKYRYLVSGRLVLGSVTAVNISCFKVMSSHFVGNFTTLINAVLGHFIYNDSRFSTFLTYSVYPLDPNVDISLTVCSIS